MIIPRAAARRLRAVPQRGSFPEWENRSCQARAACPALPRDRPPAARQPSREPVHHIQYVMYILYLLFILYVLFIAHMVNSSGVRRCCEQAGEGDGGQGCESCVGASDAVGVRCTRRGDSHERPTRLIEEVMKAQDAGVEAMPVFDRTLLVKDLLAWFQAFQPSARNPESVYPLARASLPD